MRKYLLLIGSILMLFSSIYGIYEINKPKSGAIGNGIVSLGNWMPLIFTTLGGIFLFSLSVLLFKGYRQENADLQR
jgi:hypothetical protein